MTKLPPKRLYSTAELRARGEAMVGVRRSAFIEPEFYARRRASARAQRLRLFPEAYPDNLYANVDDVTQPPFED